MPPRQSRLCWRTMLRRTVSILLFGITMSASMAGPIIGPAPDWTADAPKALPVNAPVAAPAFLDVVSFEFRADGENHKVVVTTSPLMLRVDEPDDRSSIIYNPQPQQYTGL